MAEAFLISLDSCLNPSCLFASFVVSPSPQSPKDAHHGQEAAGFDHEEREETRRMECDELRERVASWVPSEWSGCPGSLPIVNGLQIGLPRQEHRVSL